LSVHFLPVRLINWPIAASYGDGRICEFRAIFANNFSAQLVKAKCLTTGPAIPCLRPGGHRKRQLTSPQ
jgi:hypothetical protein